MVRLRLAAAGLVLAAACTDDSITPRDCSVLCAEDRTWPGSMVCLDDGYCHQPGAILCSGEPAGPDAAPGIDAAPSPDSLAAITDEEVILNPSLSGSIFRDFSGEHDFRAADFTDGADVLDNAPRRLILLEPPFAPGLAVVAGRDVLEIRADGELIAHDYTPTSPNGLGPDALSDGVLFDDAWADGPGLVMGGASPGAGDGLYKIRPDWIIERRTATGDARAIEWDAIGRYYTYPGPHAYFGIPAGIYRMNPTTFGTDRISEFNATDVRQTSDGNFVCVAGGTRIIRIVPGSVTGGTTFGSLVLAGGDRNPAAEAVHAIADGGSLVELASVNANVPLARTDTPDWVWLDAVLVYDGPLGSPNGTFYVLESNRLLDRDRILRLVRAP